MFLKSAIDSQGDTWAHMSPRWVRGGGGMSNCLRWGLGRGGKVTVTCNRVYVYLAVALLLNAMALESTFCGFIFGVLHKTCSVAKANQPKIENRLCDDLVEGVV